MCRMAAYLGPDIALEQFLLAPSHSLVVQSWAPRELRYARVNADGFGIGWYADDDMPASYINTSPIWSDTNLAHLGRSLVNDLWLANIRSATPGNPVSTENTQPFIFDDWLFMHNGYVRGFSDNLRCQFLEFLSPDVINSIRGTTDSEYIFAVLRHLLAEDEDLSIEQAIAQTFTVIEDWLGDDDALLNIIITDGELVYASKHAVNHDCPSLYTCTDDERFPGGQLIASEPLTESGLWQAVPEHCIVIMSNDDPPEFLSL